MKKSAIHAHEECDFVRGFRRPEEDARSRHRERRSSAGLGGDGSTGKCRTKRLERCKFPRRQATSSPVESICRMPSFVSRDRGARVTSLRATRFPARELTGRRTGRRAQTYDLRLETGKIIGVVG